MYGNLKSFRALEDDHIRLHKVGRTIVEESARGAQRHNAMAELEQYSRKVLDHLKHLEEDISS